ncbi:hypothetical protein ASPWEDRAFT_40354 [Aspergillus wentii DTO 134E9]|uniref:Reverse transcriptase domain-containing protein n=1 Tax=Aspergillus wentii DTO 134E9 TaxID=1073089 RepID=A0A1L9RJZ6_ASPWE|nr:uncharacterized protein ASPWEDRAFT_40354 [Aspergillus wentii DTO 134E9]KAI9923847.1 hypothetical protein MW887_008329 [Aspergillus wentii]OJJ35168.1 hypothetical protein ASPWEDRAFT_40354 [Aspergillus wentii DTO 134E9]
MATSALPQTLKSITATKIDELSKQRKIFEKRKQEITTKAANAADLRSKAQVLLEGVTALKGDPNDAFDKENLDDEEESSNTFVADCSERAAHVNIRRFLLQSRYDSSVSERSLKEWVRQLEQELRFLEMKHEHASFYSDLVTEWLGAFDDDAVSEDSPEQVGRAEMHEQRETWEKLVFSPADVDADTIKGYLDGLFAKTTLSQQALKELREKIKSVDTEFAAQRDWISVEDLEWVSKALLKSDVLTKEKTVILKEFTRNTDVAQEVVDVLNMRLASLDNWGWDPEGIPVEMRRQLNGKYRVFMDEDLLDGLMFQYIGLNWAVSFRSAFVDFLNSRAWSPLRENIPKRDKDRRNYYLDDNKLSGSSTVNGHRQKVYKKDYFMTQLPSSVKEGIREYDADNNADDADGEEARMNPLETKHSLLHLLITESLIHTAQHGQFTAVRSDFEYFGPSLPHTTILTVLAYFGVPEKWLNFFKTFLQTPLKFAQDGPNAAVQTRQRGIPMSHTLSECFGEAVLFCMDYAVNQGTNGAFLYRLHDDFWFWGHGETCGKAWTTMTEFAKVMGLRFNEEKTGTVRLGQKDKGKTDSDILPNGEIRWGFLKLDSEAGRFVIDQEQVDTHIKELEHQLSSCHSTFAWVQAWNSYFARFFTNNFSKPAICFGRDHIDMAISTLSRIESTLFSSSTKSSNGVTDYLRKVIADKFNVHDLPEGFFYFPVELGGLQLINPYISLLSMRENIKQTPKRILQKAAIQDEIKYHAAKENFEKYGASQPSAIDDSDDDLSEFMSLEEFTRYSESTSAALLDAYTDLIKIPDETIIDQTAAFRGNQLVMDDKAVKLISSDWCDMSPYWKWTAELYHDEMVKRYGGLAAVNREFMPLGVVKTLKEGKFRWQA